MGDTYFSITLQTNASLMCVEGYQIQFNGESENVSFSSPSAIFTISDGEGESVPNEIVVYTLDYENRTGQVPCIYTIPGEFPWMIYLWMILARKYRHYSCCKMLHCYLFSHWMNAVIYMYLLHVHVCLRRHWYCISNKLIVYFQLPVIVLCWTGSLRHPRCISQCLLMDILLQ